MIISNLSNLYLLRMPTITNIKGLYHYLKSKCISLDYCQIEITNWLNSLFMCSLQEAFMTSTKENEYQHESKDKIIEFINVASKTEATKNFIFYIRMLAQARAVQTLKILRFKGSFQSQNRMKMIENSVACGLEVLKFSRTREREL